MADERDQPNEAVPSLSTRDRYVILIVAFLGWLFAGVDMAITSLTGRPAAIDLLAQSGQLEGRRFQELGEQARAARTSPEAALSADERAELERGEVLTTRWFAWFQCAFLFGAAAGGLCFGRLGDRIGRSRAMAASILTYSVMAPVASQARSPLELCLLWFLACTGVGGMWPNAVALVSEAWSNLSRPAVAGVIGTAANIGIFLLNSLATRVPIRPESWRWAMLVGAAPLLLGLFSLLAVPESPRWLTARMAANISPASQHATWEVFRPPLLTITLVAILLATVPIIGGWGTANWMVPWADQVGADPLLKARVGQARSLPGIVSSLLGGWIASRLGRRRTYLAVCLASLAIAQYTFWFLIPTDPWFLAWVAALGFASGIFFGWLPLCLPELFPTRVRSTGAGVGFNFGRIVTAVTVFTSGALTKLFAGDYARLGRITSLMFLLGVLAICLAPDTSEKQLRD